MDKIGQLLERGFLGGIVIAATFVGFAVLWTGFFCLGTDIAETMVNYKRFRRRLDWNLVRFCLGIAAQPDIGK